MEHNSNLAKKGYSDHNTKIQRIVMGGMMTIVKNPGYLVLRKEIIADLLIETSFLKMVHF